MKTALLASGRGSNVRSILDRVDAGRCHAVPVGLVSDRKDAPALDLARERGLPAIVVSPKDHPSRAAWDEALAAAVAELAPDLVVLAGFMRILGEPMLARFGGRIVNIHPSLLPAFPGKDSPAQALAAGVKISGCTVHVVDAGVDSGPILAQGAVPVLLEDDAESLHARIQTVEHRLLPEVIDWVATGKICLGDELVLRAAAPDHISALVYPPLEPG
jgi:phosphoribosylglycinamide formyltransferase-1